METTEAIHNWRSIRRFKDEPVAEEALRAVLEAGRRAPSWENVQPWHFIVIEDQTMKAKLAELASGQKQVARAPVVIAVCGDLSAWDKPKNREALMELVEAGVMKVTEEIIDNISSKIPRLDREILADLDSSPFSRHDHDFRLRQNAPHIMTLKSTQHGGDIVVGAVDVFGVIKTSLDNLIRYFGATAHTERT